MFDSYSDIKNILLYKYWRRQVEMVWDYLTIIIQKKTYLTEKTSLLEQKQTNIKEFEHFQTILCLQFSFFVDILHNYANSFNVVGPFNFDNCFCEGNKLNNFISTCTLPTHELLHIEAKQK